MSHKGQRIRRPILPEGTDGPHFRQALTQVLDELADQVNYTAYDVTRVAAAAVVGSDLVLCTTGASDLALQLVKAVEFRDRTMAIKKIDAGAGQVLIDPDGTETLDGQTTYTVSAQYTVVSIRSDGDNWWVV